MDSLLIEALVDAREALEEVRDAPGARPLRIRRELLEKAAGAIRLTSSPPSHVARVATMILAVRDEALLLRGSQRLVRAAIGEAMD
jgi:hypothetical protein